MPPEGIYRVAETVSATWRSQHTDSAPVRVTLRARPNSFSAALRTSASHSLRLSDVAQENLLGRALRRAPRRTGADGSNRSLPLPKRLPPAPTYHYTRPRGAHHPSSRLHTACVTIPA